MHHIVHLIEHQIFKHPPTLCNLSSSTEIFPTILKTAEAIHIHKKDSKLEVSNNRPISLLPNIDISFEKLQSRLTEFLEEIQTLYYKQVGSQKDFSVNHSES